MRRFVWVGLACIGVIAVLAAYDVATRFVLHGEVTPRKLFVSVRSASGGGDPAGLDRHEVCHRVAAGGRSWRCEVTDPRGSGGFVRYRVDIRGDSSCWRGVVVARAFSILPGRISGCVHIDED